MKKLPVLFFILIIILGIVVIFKSKYNPGGVIRTIRPDSQTIPEISTTVPKISEPQTIISNLYVPWEIVFTPEGETLVTERSGNLVIYKDGNLKRIAINNVAEKGEGGLMGMAIDPEFNSNRFLYLYYTYSRGNIINNRVVRYRYQDREIQELKIILDAIPGSSNHNGGRINFGPDGYLYITTGDAQNKNLAQEVNSLAGKILRIDRDGGIPGDNPFGNAVYSYGHRNPQGLAWHPQTQLLYSTEHGPSLFDGPSGGDEINLIEKGGNYGWPLVSHEKNQPGLIAPLLVFTPAEAPSGDMFYTGELIPELKNNLLFTALRGQGIFSLNLSDTNTRQISDFKKIITGVGRIRAVKTGPDGYIYFATSNRDGRGQPQPDDDKIYRITIR